MTNDVSGIGGDITQIKTNTTEKTKSVRTYNQSDTNTVWGGKTYKGYIDNKEQDIGKLMDSYNDDEFAGKLGRMSYSAQEGIRITNGNVSLDSINELVQDRDELKQMQMDNENSINQAKKSKDTNGLLNDTNDKIGLKSAKKMIDQQFKETESALNKYEQQYGVEKIYTYSATNKAENIEDQEAFKNLKRCTPEKMEERLKDFGIDNNNANPKWNVSKDGRTLERVGYTGENEYIAIGVTDGKETLVRSQWKNGEMTTLVMQKKGSNIQEDELAKDTPNQPSVDGKTGNTGKEIVPNNETKSTEKNEQYNKLSDDDKKVVDNMVSNQDLKTIYEDGVNGDVSKYSEQLKNTNPNLSEDVLNAFQEQVQQKFDLMDNAIKFAKEHDNSITDDMRKELKAAGVEMTTLVQLSGLSDIGLYQS